jgi:hypothetical protein
MKYPPHSNSDLDARSAIAIITLKNRSLSPLAQLFIERVCAITRPLAKGPQR